VDHVKFVRVIEAGMDVDGDGVPDLDPSRIYYLGSSAGGTQGPLFLATEPSVRAGVLSVPGREAPEPLSVNARDGLGRSLQSRVPSLINSPGVTSLDGIPVDPPHFNENMPLRNSTPLSVRLEDGATQMLQSPQINTVAGAMEIQQVIENEEWASQAGNSAAYAPYIRRSPLDGMVPRSVIVQFANGDRVVPNPSTTAILRAGHLADRATFVRTNLAFPNKNPTPIRNNANLYPHAFTQTFPAFPNLGAIGLKAQHQMASFFVSDGTQVIDPDGVPPALDPNGVPPALDVPIFEVPIDPPLPEATNYFP
jgi:hypothetical protein